MQVLKVGKVADANELAAFNYFNSIRTQFDTIVLKSYPHTVTLGGIKQIRFVGGQTGGGRGRKTDIEIRHATGSFKISLKKEIFGAWESADTIAGDLVSEKILQYLMEDTIEFTSTTRSFTVMPYVEGNDIRYQIQKKNGNGTVALAFKCGRRDATDVVFGDDIKASTGAVVSAEFPSDASHDGNVVTVNCGHIMKSISDLPQDLWPYFTVKTSFYRKPRNKKRFPGLRVQALPQKEIESAIFLPSLR